MFNYLKNTSHLLRVFFVILIIGLVGVLWQLNTNTMSIIKSPGGTIHEGMIGAPRFINPVVAQSQADNDITRLLFTPILSIDKEGELVYFLTEDITTSADGLEYTLNLKRNLEFQDGHPLTADDVVFTIESIQDPLIKSPLATRWQGVNVEKVDQYTVSFTLARPFSDFLYNLELGVLPQHVWKNIQPEEFIFSTYNTQPLGSGPYEVSKVDIKDSGVPSRYTLSRSKTSTERTYINTIIFDFFDNEESLTKALMSGDIDAAYGITPKAVENINNERVYSATLPRVFALFLNQENQEIFQSDRIRQALALGINKNGLVNDIFNGYASPINSAFGFTDAESPYDPDKAEALLKADGWAKNNEGWYIKRTKSGETILEFSIAISNIEEMKQVAEAIQEDLAKIGIQVTIRAYDQGNFNQSILRPREYESIIFGYEVEKPTDMYAFWHSSQISDPGLNISLFRDSATDTLLNNLRNTSNPDLNRIDSSIVSKNPAVFLYSPSYIYILPEHVKGISLSIAKSSDRFNTISEWYIYTRNVWNIFTDKEEV